MHATDVRELMDSALDSGVLPDRLRHLVDESPDVADEWARQHRIHRLLDADPMVEPPMDFALRVMGRLEGELRRAPRWQRHLQRIGMILAGLLTLLWSSVTLSQHWQLADAGPTMVALGQATLSGSIAMADAWLEASSTGGLGWLLYGVLAVMLAAAWFGVLVLPRAMERRADSEAVQ